MKLTFLGTRGNISDRTKLHHRHTSLLVSRGAKSVMIDAGVDWEGELDALSPDAIVITHAHPDHAWGLKSGSPCPVHATAEAWSAMAAYPIEGRHVLSAYQPADISGMLFVPFPVEHSTVAPAVGYRVSTDDRVVFYVPDVVYIHKREVALKGVDIFIGDGATITRSMVRKRGDQLIGHTPIQTQLTWCEKEGIPRAYFTHCGSQIVSGSSDAVSEQVRRMGAARGVEADIAYDGLQLVL